MRTEVKRTEKYVFVTIHSQPEFFSRLLGIPNEPETYHSKLNQWGNRHTPTQWFDSKSRSVDQRPSIYDLNRIVEEHDDREQMNTLNSR